MSTHQVDSGRIALTFRIGTLAGLPSVSEAIAAHQRISREKGRVALGKPGRALAKISLDRVLAVKEPLLLIVSRIDECFIGYTAPIHGVLSNPQHPENALIPHYYQHMRSDIQTWFILGPMEHLANAKLAACTLCSNQHPLLDVLRRSQTANMLVRIPNII
jgi:hypothetical protein